MSNTNQSDYQNFVNALSHATDVIERLKVCREKIFNEAPTMFQTFALYALDLGFSNSVFNYQLFRNQESYHDFEDDSIKFRLRFNFESLKFSECTGIKYQNGQYEFLYEGEHYELTFDYNTRVTSLVSILQQLPGKLESMSKDVNTICDNIDSLLS